jgi:sporulation protein YlmC with PRC-barrel domain
MLHNLKELYGDRLAALDGDIGHAKDFYFDDKTWAVRYLVVDTGSWLTGRLVLLSPHAFAKWDRYEKTLHVKLHKKQIENSPGIDSHRPVSRQFEEEYYQYYGWPAYWQGDQIWGMGGYPVMMPVAPQRPPARPAPRSRADVHLQSAQALTGLHIQTVDGTIGHVSGLMVDDKSWAIHDLVVETGHWYSGRQILISPARIDRISYEESKVFVNLTKEDIERTAENQLAKAGAGNQEAKNFTD